MLGGFRYFYCLVLQTRMMTEIKNNTKNKLPILAIELAKPKIKNNSLNNLLAYRIST